MNIREIELGGEGANWKRRQVVENDDIEALMDIPRRLARAAVDDRAERQQEAIEKLVASQLETLEIVKTLCETGGTICAELVKVIASLDAKPVK